MKNFTQRSWLYWIPLGILMLTFIACSSSSGNDDDDDDAVALEDTATFDEDIALVDDEDTALVDDEDTALVDEGTTTGCARAEYEVTFDSTWSADTHPTDFPSNPHFSGLIGATHNADVTFWATGSLASPGIESMAETGGKTLLTNEVEEAIDNGTARTVLSGSGIGLSPGSVSLVFSVNQAFPLVTLVSMLAPSPDWFVGISGMSLCENDEWVDSKVVTLFTYDSGTDSGLTFTSDNADTDPAETIFRVADGPLLVGEEVPSVGTFTFTRQ